MQDTDYSKNWKASSELITGILDLQSPSMSFFHLTSQP